MKPNLFIQLGELVMWLKNNSFLKTVRFNFTIRYFGFFISLLIILFVFINQFAGIYIDKKSNKKIIETLNDLDWMYINRSESFLYSKINNIIDYKSVPQGIENVFYVLYSSDSIVISSDLSYWPGIDSLVYSKLAVDTTKAESGKYWLKRIKKNAYLKKVFYPVKQQNIKIGYFEIKEGLHIIIGQSLTEDLLFKKQLLYLLGFSFLIILLMGFVVVFFLINKTMNDIETVTKTAAKIEKGDLKQRVNLQSNKREISNLINSFNSMLDRISLLLHEINGVSNDIAHDLRSPITSIRVLSETALTGNASIGENKIAFEKIITKCDYLVSMINTLLEIVEIESSTKVSSFKPMDIKEIIMVTYDLFITLAEEKRIKFNLDLDKDPLVILGDQNLLQRAISNFVDNAIKYNWENGEITLNAFRKNKKIIIHICDSGMGISGNEINNIFKKFYRADKSRSLEGNGLGLSFSSVVITKHKGSIDVSSNLNKGSCFQIILPENTTSLPTL